MRDKWTPTIGLHLHVQPWQMDDLRPAELAGIVAAAKHIEKSG